METLPRILPPGIPLIRTFRTDCMPIPTFLQDLLVDWSSRVPQEHLTRLNELIKHVQCSVSLNSFDQGKIWYVVRNILHKGMLADEAFFRDGRNLRNILLGELTYTLTPYSPIHKRVNIARRKQELHIMSPRPLQNLN
jgi:hypothetical protein